MHTKKVTQVINTLASINKLAQSGVIFWNTLLLPALIAIFVTHLLDVQKADGSISLLVWFLALIVLLVHLFIVYLQYRGSTMDTMLVEYQDKDLKLNDVATKFNDVKNFYESDTKYFSSQRTATRFAVGSLSYAIGKIRNSESKSIHLNEEDIQAMVHSLIWPLVVYREQLFSFEAGTRWNIALYRPTENGDLVPKWRKCDERINPRNRSWKQGFGVVGMSYLHKTIKYYSDIKNNSDNDHNSESDLETYRSIIAVPIIPCEDSTSESDYSPSGVLLITSSEPDQFNLDRDATFLQIYANLMAILLEKVQTYSEHVHNQVPSE